MTWNPSKNIAFDDARTLYVDVGLEGQAGHGELQSSMLDHDPNAHGPARRNSTRGRLKVFLGYASGVGKSFRMFDEARRRKERGQDVVVAALQPQVSPEIAPILSSLEIVP